MRCVAPSWLSLSHLTSANVIIVILIFILTPNVWLLQLNFSKIQFKVLLQRKFLSLFPSFFNINLFYRFKIIQIAKILNLTCVRGLEISVQKVRKYHLPLYSSQNSPRHLRKAVLHLAS